MGSAIRLGAQLECLDHRAGFGKRRLRPSVRVGLSRTCRLVGLSQVLQDGLKLDKVNGVEIPCRQSFIYLEDGRLGNAVVVQLEQTVRAQVFESRL